MPPLVMLMRLLSLCVPNTGMLMVQSCESIIEALAVVLISSQQHSCYPCIIQVYNMMKKMYSRSADQRALS